MKSMCAYLSSVREAKSKGVTQMCKENQSKKFARLLVSRPGEVTEGVCVPICMR